MTSDSASSHGSIGTEVRSNGGEVEIGYFKTRVVGMPFYGENLLLIPAVSLERSRRKELMTLL